MASGGYNQDWSEAENIFRNTKRTFHFVIYDSAGVAVTSFAGWDVEWFLLEDHDHALSTAIVHKTEGAGVNANTAPDVYVTMDAEDDWANLDKRPYAHQLRRTDADDEDVLAWGEFVIIG